MTDRTVPLRTADPGAPLELPLVGLGTYKIGTDLVPNTLRVALEAGYRALDTAAFYGNEQAIGDYLAQVDQAEVPRGEVLVTSKLWHDDLGADQARAAFDETCSRLGLGDRALDVYLIHWPAPARDLYVQTWQALRDLRDEGRIRAIGVCNFEIEHLQRLIDETGEAPALNQVELHPRFAQRELRAYHAEHGIVTQAWAPLERGGVLQDPVVVQVSEETGMTPAQVVLRWHVQAGTVVIPKSATPDRLRENIAVLHTELSDEQMARIDGLDAGPAGRTGPAPADMG